MGARARLIALPQRHHRGKGCEYRRPRITDHHRAEAGRHSFVSHAWAHRTGASRNRLPASILMMICLSLPSPMIIPAHIH